MHSPEGLSKNFMTLIAKNFMTLIDNVESKDSSDELGLLFIFTHITIDCGFILLIKNSHISTNNIQRLL